MTNRQKENEKLLEILKDLVTTYPEQRFSQILGNYYFVENAGPDTWGINKWEDEYHLESKDLLQRVEERVKICGRPKQVQSKKRTRRNSKRS